MPHINWDLKNLIMPSGEVTLNRVVTRSCMEDSMTLFKLFVCSVITMFSFAVSAQDDAVVATVGSKKITKKEFDQKYKEVLEKTINPPSKNIFLEDLVRYELGVLEAQNKNLDKDPVVQERFRQLMYVDLLEKEVGTKVDKVNISEKDMRAYYSKNPEIKTSHILIEIKENASVKEREAAKKRAQEIYAEVRASKRPFEELAKLYSDDVISKKNGGDIGWHSSVTLLPEYYGAALKLKNKQISNLVETKFGFHIIQLTGKKEYKDAEKTQLRAAVLNEKKRAMLDSYFSKLKSKYPVKINAKGL